MTTLADSLRKHFLELLQEAGPGKRGRLEDARATGVSGNNPKRPSGTSPGKRSKIEDARATGVSGNNSKRSEEPATKPVRAKASPADTAEAIAKDLNDKSNTVGSSKPTGGLTSIDEKSDGAEVFKSRNGTVVYSTGAIKDGTTGQTRYPMRIFPDGSIRYDDGSTASPGSIAAATVTNGLSREDRARLYQAGAQGLETKDLAAVKELIEDAVRQEVATRSQDAEVDGVLAEQAAGELVDPGLAGSLAAQGSGSGSGGVDPALAALHRQRFDIAKQRVGEPVKVKRGEKVTTGPQGGRGIWRSVGGNPIFIKLGQSEQEAASENAARKSQQREKQLAKK